MPRTWVPTMARVGIVAATFGLVGVLAHHYTHVHNAVASTNVVPSTVGAATVMPPVMPSIHSVNAPVDPDASGPAIDLSEMHVKVPAPVEDRSAPSSRQPQSSRLSPASTIAPAAPKLEIPQTATPNPLPPIQTAVSLPPTIATPPAIAPGPQQLVSVVSLEPAEPGFLARGINRIPVVNLLQRRKFRSGDKFLPPVPARQVKPKLPIDWARDNGHPPPVDVKVWIDKTGQVTRAELLSESPEPDIADLAANAALKWTFEPARVADRPVSSEMVMHFRFAAKSTY